MSPFLLLRSRLRIDILLMLHGRIDCVCALWQIAVELVRLLSGPDGAAPRRRRWFGQVALEHATVQLRVLHVLQSSGSVVRIAKLNETKAAVFLWTRRKQKQIRGSTETTISDGHRSTRRRPADLSDGRTTVTAAAAK